MSDQKRVIGIGVPCQDQVDAFFYHSMLMACVHHAYAFPNDDIIHSIHQSAFLAEARNKIVKDLIEQGATHILFVDTDMRVPQTLLNDLAKHDLPVVAANCAKRRRPISATARKENPADPSKLEAVWPDPNKMEGLERVHVVGAAVMCIKAETFMELPYPWFNTPWLEDEQGFVGEDLYFCSKLKEYDIPLYIDHAVSWQVGHVGQYVYEMKDVLAERELARQGKWDHVRPQVMAPTQKEAEIILAKR